MRLRIRRGSRNWWLAILSARTQQVGRIRTYVTSVDAGLGRPLPIAFERDDASIGKSRFDDGEPPANQDRFGLGPFECDNPRGFAHLLLGREPTGRDVVGRPLSNTKGLAPNICRLISFIAMDGKRSMQGLPWGAAFSLTALPRVRHRKLVLLYRRCLLNGIDFGRSGTSAQLAPERLREEWGMPQYVYLRQGDNLLLLDLLSSIAGELLFDQISPVQTVELQEALPSPQELWLTEPTGSYVAEFVGSLHPFKAPNQIESMTYSPIKNRIRHGPGSQWLFTKIFLGSQGMQDSLLRLLAPIIAEYRQSCGLSCWFFIRYSEPSDHLRVRFRSDSAEVSHLRKHFLQFLELQLREDVISRYTVDI